MKLDELGARAGANLRHEVDLVDAPDPAAVIRRWRRARARTAAVVVALAVAVAVGALIVANGSSDNRISTIRPIPAPIAHADAVPTFLWVDGADVAASNAFYEQLLARLARVGESVAGRTCNPAGLAGTGLPHVLFEDPVLLRRDGGLAATVTSPTPAAYPPLPQPTCSVRVARAALRLAASVGQLLPAWYTQIRALESTPTIAQGLQGEIACMTARGYTIGADGYISTLPLLLQALRDGYPPGGSPQLANPQATEQFWAQAGRDYADCLPPLLAAREPVRRAARTEFVAEHRADVRRMQRSLDSYVRAVETAKPPAIKERVRKRIAGFVTDKARSLGEDHPTQIEAVLATRREATALTGSPVADDTLIYLVQFRGHFHCAGCPNPTGAAGTSGTVATLVLDARSLGELDLGLTDRTVDLARLGVVNGIPPGG